MITRAVRFYGDEMKLEEFILPTMKDDEILASVVTDTLCLSTYKAVKQGKAHVRVPDDVKEKPIIIGHEFCGEILRVGKKWKDKYKAGQKYIIQPALNYEGSLNAPGYSYQYIGGSATKIIIPNEVMEMGCLIEYKGESYFSGCLAEPLSCIVGSLKTMFHTEPGDYTHKMGIRKGGNLIIFGGAGPMGIATVDYIINSEIKPRMIVVTDIQQEKLDKAKSIVTIDEAKRKGIDLIYLNGKDKKDQAAYLMELTEDKGYDDIFLYAAVRPLVELADSLLAKDGCLNLFAGPYDKKFMSTINFYNIHYSSTHMVGISGGTIDDMKEYLNMVEKGKMNPSVLITHIGGLDSVIDSVVDLINIPGGKKLIYTGIELDLTAIDDFKEKGKTNPMFAELSMIVAKHNNLWTKEAENYLLSYYAK